MVKLIFSGVECFGVVGGFVIDLIGILIFFLVEANLNMFWVDLIQLKVTS